MHAALKGAAGKKRGGCLVTAVAAALVAAAVLPRRSPKACARPLRMHCSESRLDVGVLIMCRWEQIERGGGRTNGLVEMHHNAPSNRKKHAPKGKAPVVREAPERAWLLAITFVSYERVVGYYTGRDCWIGSVE